MRVVLLSFVLLACGKDPKVEQAKNEIDSIAASLERQTRGDEGSMGTPNNPCPIKPDPSLPKIDPWGHPYTFECGNGYQVISDGPDGKPGTKDDLRSMGRRNPLPP